MLSIGQLDRVIEVTSPTYTRDKYGAETKVYATVKRGRQRFVDQTRRMFGEIDVQRFESLGVLDRFEPLELGRIKAGVKVKAKARQVPKVKTKLKTLIEERELLKQLTGVRTKQVYKARQAQRMKMLLRTKLKFKPFEQKLITPPVVIPKGFVPPIIPILIFKLPMVKRKKKKLELGISKSDLLYVPSATAHFLGIKKVMSEKEMLRKAELGIDLREIPIIK